LEKSNLWSQKNKIFLFGFLFFGGLFCYPVDPNYQTKPLQNTSYSGFISRNFFQVVVEVKIPEREFTIAEERNHCKSMSFVERNKKTLALLREEANYNSSNQKRFRYDSQAKEEEEILNSFQSSTKEWRKNSASSLIQSKNPDLSTGEFAWLLDDMFLFREDYSNAGKCIFVYRVIQENLYKKVYETNLASPSQWKSKNDPSEK
jgi:hypothetical protein